MLTPHAKCDCIIEVCKKGASYYSMILDLYLPYKSKLTTNLTAVIQYEQQKFKLTINANVNLASSNDRWGIVIIIIWKIVQWCTPFIKWIVISRTFDFVFI